MGKSSLAVQQQPVQPDDDTSYADLVPCGSSEGMLDHQLAGPVRKVTAEDCEAVLDVQESCVSCVEGVSLQHEYEQNATKPMTLVDRVLPDGGPPLTRHEAAMIRLQAMEQEQQRIQLLRPPGSAPTLPEIDILSLNLCGTDSEDIDDQRARSRRVVSPYGVQETQGLVRPDSVPEESVQDGRGEACCAVCLDEVIPHSSSKVSFAKLPCCGQADETNTVKVCSACVVLLTQPTADGSSRVGRCPRCRSWIAVCAPDGSAPLNLDISTVAIAGTCRECNQSKENLVDDNVCDACFVGKRIPLLYECEQCHGTQRIPHPMYRYQYSPGDFGKKTWSCEGDCQAFTHWRIRHDQIVQIPVGDSPWPESDWSATARKHIHEARRQLQVAPATASECCIL
mmetsp:Transcript_33960/g.70616  ORF Transcript_33960/g.70616 Transcript_33960/m.70616 type:complete len:396 (-) Transcript_33960:396-1583(-)